MKNQHRKWRLSIAILLVTATACTSKLTPQSELTTQVIALKDATKCQHLGYTKTGITEKNSKMNEAEGGFAVDEKLLIRIRNLASEIGADTVVPIYEDDHIIQEFKLYICNAKQ